MLGDSDTLCRLCMGELSELDKKINYEAESLPDIAYICEHFFDIDIIQQPELFSDWICNLCKHTIIHFQELCAVAKERAKILKEIENEGPLLARADDSFDQIDVFVKEEPALSEPLDEEYVASTSDNASSQPQVTEDYIASQEIKEEEAELSTDDLLQVTDRSISNKTSHMLSCPQCERLFLKKYYLDAHVLGDHHGDPEPFLCNDCDCGFKRYDLLRSHIRSAHPESVDNVVKPTCPHCKSEYKTKKELLAHYKQHPKHKPHIKLPESERFKCPQCPQLFTFKNAISRHVRVVHEGVRRYQCTNCPKRFGTHTAQLRHEQRLHNQVG